MRMRCMRDALTLALGMRMRMLHAHGYAYADPYALSLAGGICMRRRMHHLYATRFSTCPMTRIHWVFSHRPSATRDRCPTTITRIDDHIEFTAPMDLSMGDSSPPKATRAVRCAPRPAE